VDEFVAVGEDDVADAMVVLLERAKLVVEGAGAVGIAALRTGAVTPAARGATVVVLSGGNVDAGVLAGVARRNETAQGRRMRLFTRVDDRPGGLARLLVRVAEAGGNLVTVSHLREAVPLHVRETGVDLVLETRGEDHADAIVSALTEAGYEIARFDGDGHVQEAAT
jgi:threonine dehydratase